MKEAQREPLAATVIVTESALLVYRGGISFALMSMVAQAMKDPNGCCHYLMADRTKNRMASD